MPNTSPKAETIHNLTARVQHLEEVAARQGDDIARLSALVRPLVADAITAKPAAAIPQLSDLEEALIQIEGVATLIIALSDGVSDIGRQALNPIWEALSPAIRTASEVCEKLREASGRDGM